MRGVLDYEGCIDVECIHLFHYICARPLVEFVIKKFFSPKNACCCLVAVFCGFRVIVVVFPVSPYQFDRHSRREPIGDREIERGRDHYYSHAM